MSGRASIRRTVLGPPPSVSTTTSGTTTINYFLDHKDRNGIIINVGDYVVVVESGWGVTKDYVGKVGKIVELSNGITNISLSFPGEQNLKMISSKGVNKVEAEKIKLNKIKLPKI